MMDSIGRRAATKLCLADASNLVNAKLDTEEEGVSNARAA
jgi:hypothetical protein